MDINNFFQKLNAIYKHDEIQDIHQITNYLRTHGYQFTYVETSILIESKAFSGYDMIRFSRMIQKFQMDMVMIPSGDKIKIYIDRKKA